MGPSKSSGRSPTHKIANEPTESSPGRQTSPNQRAKLDRRFASPSLSSTGTDDGQRELTGWKKHLVEKLDTDHQDCTAAVTRLRQSILELDHLEEEGFKDSEDHAVGNDSLASSAAQWKAQPKAALEARLREVATSLLEEIRT